jgi:integrase
MASVRRYRTAKGETRYSVRWRDADGQEHERAAGPRHDDAKRLRLEVERRQALGALYHARGQSFGAAVDDFLDRHATQVRPSTIDRYRSLAREAEALRGLRVEDVSADVLGRLVAAKARTAPVRAGGVLRFVRLVLADCEARGLVVDARVRHVKAPRKPEPRRRYLAWAEVEQLVAAAEHPDDRAAILLGAGCGLRWQEAFALTADDVQGGRVRVARALTRDAKVGQVKARASRRVVPIPAAIADQVAWAAARHPHGPLVPNPKGRAWNPSRWQAERWNAIRAAAGVACRYHDLRHTYAAHLVAAGVHPKALQRLLGHATIGVTLDTYGHLLPEALDDAVAALDTVLARESQRAVWGQCGDGEP